MANTHNKFTVHLLTAAILAGTFFGNLAAPPLFPDLRVSARNPHGDALTRMAERLEKRLRTRQAVVPPLSAIKAALTEREKIIKHTVTVHLNDQDAVPQGDWIVNIQKYPEWFLPRTTSTEMRFGFEVSAMIASIERSPPEGVTKPQDVSILGVLTGAVLRAQTTGTAVPGRVLDYQTLVPQLAIALQTGLPEFSTTLRDVDGVFVNLSGFDLGALQLLATGRSDFAGSPTARIANIHKGLTEKLQNVIVPAGEEFSFNAVLDGPVSESRGWKLAKVIFNGTELRLAPGGGICQVSTTMLRAILKAGFVPIEQKNHSLYVSYYEKYGVGLDATIFPGQQDLTFRNDSPGPILVQTEIRGTEAFVRLYGTSDGRSVELVGPYLAATAPEGFLVNGRAMRGGEIAWIQRVERPNGQAQEFVLLSKYYEMPAKSLLKKLSLHASALAMP